MIPKISASAIYSTLGNNSSLIPLGIKDIANSCGVTTASYIAGDGLEGKDRFIDEFGTEAIWLGGIPAYKYVLNKTLFKIAKFDPEIDPRLFKNKKILALAKKYAPTEEIKENIKKAAKQQNLFKSLALTKFAASTVLTAVSYFALTKFRHKYTENQIKKDYYEKQQQEAQNKRKEVAFESAFSPVHKNKNISFKGGIQDFMFDPVKNMMLVDGTITGERLTHSRNSQDFIGYAIKEGSLWAFMYFAGPIIAKHLEKQAEKQFNKSITLDARVIESEELKNVFKDGSLKKHLQDFKANKSDTDVYRFAVSPKTKNIVVDMAKKSDIISLLKNSDKVDTRKYIDIAELRGVAEKLEKLLSQYEASGEDLDIFFKSLRKLKRTSVIKNIGSCITALGVIVPAIMLLVRKLSPNSEYQVKKDVEAQLKKS